MVYDYYSISSEWPIDQYESLNFTRSQNLTGKMMLIQVENERCSSKLKIFELTEKGEITVYEKER